MFNGIISVMRFEIPSAIGMAVWLFFLLGIIYTFGLYSGLTLAWAMSGGIITLVYASKQQLYYVPMMRKLEKLEKQQIYVSNPEDRY